RFLFREQTAHSFVDSHRARQLLHHVGTVAREEHDFSPSAGLYAFYYVRAFRTNAVGVSDQSDHLLADRNAKDRVGVLFETGQVRLEGRADLELLALHPGRTADSHATA